ncbi:unnamed protein product [Discosporangium mesarthrocarpum]
METFKKDWDNNETTQQLHAHIRQQEVQKLYSSLMGKRQRLKGTKEEAQELAKQRRKKETRANNHNPNINGNGNSNNANKGAKQRELDERIGSLQSSIVMTQQDQIETCLTYRVFAAGQLHQRYRRLRLFFAQLQCRVAGCGRQVERLCGGEREAEARVRALGACMVLEGVERACLRWAAEQNERQLVEGMDREEAKKQRREKAKAKSKQVKVKQPVPATVAGAAVAAAMGESVVSSEVEELESIPASSSSPATGGAAAAAEVTVAAATVAATAAGKAGAGGGKYGGEADIGVLATTEGNGSRGLSSPSSERGEGWQEVPSSKRPFMNGSAAHQRVAATATATAAMGGEDGFVTIAAKTKPRLRAGHGRGQGQGHHHASNGGHSWDGGPCRGGGGRSSSIASPCADGGGRGGGGGGGWQGAGQGGGHNHGGRGTSRGERRGDHKDLTNGRQAGLGGQTPSWVVDGAGGSAWSHGGRGTCRSCERVSSGPCPGAGAGTGGSSVPPEEELPEPVHSSPEEAEAVVLVGAGVRGKAAGGLKGGDEASLGSCNEAESASGKGGEGGVVVSAGLGKVERKGEERAGKGKGAEEGELCGRAAGERVVVVGQEDLEDEFDIQFGTINLLDKVETAGIAGSTPPLVGNGGHQDEKEGEEEEDTGGQVEEGEGVVETEECSPSSSDAGVSGRQVARDLTEEAEEFGSAGAGEGEGCQAESRALGGEVVQGDRTSSVVGVHAHPPGVELPHAWDGGLLWAAKWAAARTAARTTAGAGTGAGTGAGEGVPTRLPPAAPANTQVAGQEDRPVGGGGKGKGKGGSKNALGTVSTPGTGVGGDLTSSVAPMPRGLTNATGQNNCFLNVVVQSLWHLDAFRTQFARTGSAAAIGGGAWDRDHKVGGGGRLCFEVKNQETDQTHGCSEEPSRLVESSLRSVFQELSVAGEEGASPGAEGSAGGMEGEGEAAARNTSASVEALRQALSKLSNARFGVGKMDDAAEAMEAILSCLEQGTCSRVIQRVFTMTIREALTCPRCGTVSPEKPTEYGANVFYAHVSALREARDKWGKGHRPFDDILKDASHGDLVACRQFSCPLAQRRERLPSQRSMTGQRPSVFTLGLVWNNWGPELVSDLLTMLSPSVDLDVVLGNEAHVAQKGQGGTVAAAVADRGGKAQLRGFFCFQVQKHHYVAFVYNKARREWHLLDDDKAVPVSERAWVTVGEVFSPSKLLSPVPHLLCRSSLAFLW